MNVLERIQEYEKIKDNDLVVKCSFDKRPEPDKIFFKLEFLDNIDTETKQYLAEQLFLKSNEELSKFFSKAIKEKLLERAKELATALIENAKKLQENEYVKKYANNSNNLVESVTNIKEEINQPVIAHSQEPVPIGVAIPLNQESDLSFNDDESSVPNFINQ